SAEAVIIDSTPVAQRPIGTARYGGTGRVRRKRNNPAFFTHSLTAIVNAYARPSHATWPALANTISTTHAAVMSIAPAMVPKRLNSRRSELVGDSRQRAAAAQCGERHSEPEQIQERGVDG